MPKPVPAARARANSTHGSSGVKGLWLPPAGLGGGGGGAFRSCAADGRGGSAFSSTATLGSPLRRNPIGGIYCRKSVTLVKVRTGSQHRGQWLAGGAPPPPPKGTARAGPPESRGRQKG